MIEIWMLRHGKTEGNLKKRYIGVTDEHLCREGIAELKEMAYPQVEAVYVSPLIRCIQTAELLYPGSMPQVVEDFRECDFGAFENKNYLELAGNPEYQAWIDSGGAMDFPDGESVMAFKRRVQDAFVQTVSEALEKKEQKIALVVHGGTIMGILERFGIPKGEYYRWQVKNGRGYHVVLDEQGLSEERIEHMVDF